MKRIYEYDDGYESDVATERRFRPRKSLKHTEQTDDKVEGGLEPLLSTGFVDRILTNIKSGKEATVYLAQRGNELIAAKLYTELSHRSFKNDQSYRAGRYNPDQRAAKAIDQRTDRGKAFQLALWTLFEYQQLWELYHAGIRVPKPALGPAPSEYAESGRVVLMEFIGEGEVPAPRLSDLRLDREEATDALRQSLAILETLTRLGKVHGDFSTYNLLWHRGEVVVIDFPQLMLFEENPHARDFLERDVVSLATSFQRHHVSFDVDAVTARLEALIPR